MTLATARRKLPHATRRFVTTSVVSEEPLPYNLQAADTPELLHEFWIKHVAAAPDHEADKENLVCVILSPRLAPFAWHRISLGTVNEASCHPREVLRPVIAAAGYAFVLMHNHPSGDPSPSQSDEGVTRRLLAAAKLLELRFLDHLVVGRPAPGRSPYYSFREAGLIP